jgi:hypothetical protein
VSRTRSGLIVVLRLVGLEQRDVAAHLLVGRVHIAEDLGARRFGQLLAAVDVDQRALLLALVLVEDAQRNVDAEAERLDAVGVVVRRVVGVPRAEGRIGGAVGLASL